MAEKSQNSDNPKYRKSNSHSKMVSKNDSASSSEIVYPDGWLQEKVFSIETKLSCLFAKKKYDTQDKWLDRVFVFGVSFGILTMIACFALFITHTVGFQLAAKAAGSGLFFVFVGLHGPMMKRTRRLNQIKGKYCVLKKAFLVVATGVLNFVTGTILTFAILGLHLFCKSFFIIYYRPDLGLCECDVRPLLRNEIEPAFDVVANLENNELQTVTIATIGDTDIYEMEPTLNLIKQKGVDLLVLNGDLSYQAQPVELGALIDSTFGETFPAVITVGNHDTGIYTEYQDVFAKRYAKYIASVTDSEGNIEAGALRCSGEIGVNEVCSFKDLGLILSGLGSTCMDDDELNSGLEQQLNFFADEDVIWRNIYIHKNQKLLQVGDKEDEVGNFAYEAALDYGAWIINSHEHQYARTKQLKQIGINPGEFVLAQNSDLEESIDGIEVVRIGNHNTVVVLNGIGANSMRSPDEELLQNVWWQKNFHKDSDNANVGAHFCEYNVKDRSDLAFCYFETVDGIRPDEYFMRSTNGL